MLSIVQLSRFDAVLRCFSRDSYIRLSQLSSFVNNFFKLFFAVVFVISLSLDSPIRLPYLSFLVNTIFYFFTFFYISYYSKICRIKFHRGVEFNPAIKQEFILFAFSYMESCRYSINMLNLMQHQTG